MQINVSGFGKARTAEIKEAVEFFAKQLMHGKTVKNLQIDVEKCSHLDVCGECIDEDGTRNPRWFTINLRGSRKDEDIIKTLAHEMVHVKQHAKNELQSGTIVASKGGISIHSKWMGKIWKPNTKEHYYWDSPWEIEAYGREVGLYHKWVEYCAK
jgi:hypothetical protein